MSTSRHTRPPSTPIPARDALPAEPREGASSFPHRKLVSSRHVLPDGLLAAPLAGPRAHRSRSPPPLMPQTPTRAFPSCNAYNPRSVVACASPSFSPSISSIYMDACSCSLPSTSPRSHPLSLVPPPPRPTRKRSASPSAVYSRRPSEDSSSWCSPVQIAWRPPTSMQDTQSTCGRPRQASSTRPPATA